MSKAIGFSGLSNATIAAVAIATAGSIVPVPFYFLVMSPLFGSTLVFATAQAMMA